MRLSSMLRCTAVRARFAPSPTGELHLGGLRTALFNYLFAKKNGGKFVLRIEDTDRTRIVKGAQERMEGILEKLGILPDESPSKGGDFGPYLQSHRLQDYRSIASQLVDLGVCYRCFCTPIRLDMIRRVAQQQKTKIGYDGKCRSIAKDESLSMAELQNESFTIRLKLNNEQVQFEDMIYANHANNISLVEGDPILLKSDGYPTYHLANVVDDHNMQISHVIRGEEWLDSTLKHIIIYKALKWEPPKFAHLPLLMQKGGGKLSKRLKDTFVQNLLDQGYTKDVLLNFVSRGGGGFSGRDDKIIYTMETLIEMFDIQTTNPKPLITDYTWLHGYSTQHMSKSVHDKDIAQEIVQAIKQKVTEFASNNEIQLLENVLTDEYLNSVLKFAALDKRLMVVENVIGEEFQYLWILPNPTNKIITYFPLSEASLITNKFVQLLHKQNWETFVKGDPSTSNELLKSLAQELGIKYAKLMRFIRIILTNSDAGFPLLQLLNIFGRDMTFVRLENAQKFMCEYAFKKRFVAP